MTLIIGILCSDGIVMAADSASTDMDAGTKQSSDHKIVHLKGPKTLFGGSGDVGLLQKIQERIGKMHPSREVSRFRLEIKKEIVEELKLSQQLHVAYPARGTESPPPAICLIGGYTDKSPFLFEYEKNGSDTDYSKAGLGGFVAIGSGKNLAHALFRQHLFKDRDVKTGKVILYRVISEAIAISAYLLSEPIHMFCMSPDGNVEILDDTSRTNIKNTVELWRQLEIEALGKALAPDTSQETDQEIPKMSDQKEVPLPGSK